MSDRTVGYNTFRNNRICFNFRFRKQDDSYSHQTRSLSRALDMSEMRLRAIARLQTHFVCI